MPESDAEMADAWAAYARAKPAPPPPAPTDFLSQHAPRVLRALQRLPPQSGHACGPHTCSRTCQLVEGPAPDARYVYVCRASGHVHLCTADLCRYTEEVYPRGGCADSTLPEYLVCELTHVAYPPPLATEAMVERASHVPDYESVARRRRRWRAEADSGQRQREAEPFAPPTRGDAEQDEASARAMPPKRAAAALHKREEQYWTTVGALWEELRPGQPEYDWLHRTFVCLWQLLGQSRQFEALAGKMGADMFALAVCYQCRRGLTLPARDSPGQTHVLLDAVPAWAARLPLLRTNPHFNIRRLTAAQKAIQCCLSGLTDAQLAAYAQRRPRREDFAYAPPEGRVLHSSGSPSPRGRPARR